MICPVIEEVRAAEVPEEAAREAAVLAEEDLEEDSAEVPEGDLADTTVIMHRPRPRITTIIVRTVTGMAALAALGA